MSPTEVKKRLHAGAVQILTGSQQTRVDALVNAGLCLCLSSLKDERVKACEVLRGSDYSQIEGNKQQLIDHIGKALYASKIISYTQGFMMLREAAKEFNWKLNYGGIALMWKGGCIIRR